MKLNVIVSNLRRNIFERTEPTVEAAVLTVVADRNDKNLPIPPLARTVELQGLYSAVAKEYPVGTLLVVTIEPPAAPATPAPATPQPPDP
jgi:hypothetical protein